MKIEKRCIPFFIIGANLVNTFICLFGVNCDTTKLWLWWCAFVTMSIFTYPLNVE